MTDGTTTSDCADNKRLEMMSRLLSSMGCSWNSNKPNYIDGISKASSSSVARLPVRKLYHPSLSLTQDYNEEQDKKDHDSDSSSHRRKAVQSKASKLMARKTVYPYEESEQRTLPPKRVMLENILESFDHLVDARIRAYAQILRNHIRVLWESDNIRGARIAEYKLQTLLEFASNHLLFDSISTKFNECCTGDNDWDNDEISNTTTANKEEKEFSLPIQLTVEIRSPRFFLEGAETVNPNDGDCPPHRRHQRKLTFKANGKVRGKRIIGRYHKTSNDTDRCPTPETRLCRNNTQSNRTTSRFYYENINIDIDCDHLLSQMMEEASKVVTMAVELTNMTWKNNTQKQEEINEMNVNGIMAENTRKTANIIADDDYSSSVGEHRPQQATGKRSRCDGHQETDGFPGTTISKKVSEVSISPHAQTMCDEGPVEQLQVSSTTSAATITNIHVLDQDAERNARYFVSDPSYESSSFGSDHDQTLQQDDGNEGYNNITAERACNIVDFVLAGDIITCPSSSNKRLRTK